MGETTKGQLAGYAAAAVVAAIAGWLVLGGGGGGSDRSPPGAISLAGEGAAGGAGERSSRRRRVYVHVAGAVRRPGLYRVPAGARVAAAVRRAGGFTRRAEPLALNLALKVQDGQQVVVPARGEAATAAGAAGATGANAGPGIGAGSQEPVQLSTATVEQLDGLDGIGPTLAERIIEYREKHGGFRSLEELREVEGIGEKRFATLRRAVRP